MRPAGSFASGRPHWRAERGRRTSSTTCRASRGARPRAGPRPPDSSSGRRARRAAWRPARTAGALGGRRGRYRPGLEPGRRPPGLEPDQALETGGVLAGNTVGPRSRSRQSPADFSAQRRSATRQPTRARNGRGPATRQPTQARNGRGPGHPHRGSRPRSRSGYSSPRL
jgi:hypothetical protein